MRIVFRTSNRFERFGSLDGDNAASDYLTTVYHNYGEENIMKHEIILLPNNNFRVGVTIKIPDVEEAQKEKLEQNKIKIN